MTGAHNCLEWSWTWRVVDGRYVYRCGGCKKDVPPEVQAMGGPEVRGNARVECAACPEAVVQKPGTLAIEDAWVHQATAESYSRTPDHHYARPSRGKVT